MNELDSAPFSRPILFAVVVCALGFTFDLAEISFGAALSGVFSSAPYAISPRELSWLLASVYIGAVVGPAVVGIVADRRGRRNALAATLLVLAVTSFASAASPGILWLSIIRGISGVALGAYPPLMITYLTDILPARLRGPLTMVTIAIAYLGPPETIFLMRWLTPLAPLGLEGWRWVIAIEGIGALVGGLLFLALPESRRWLRAAAAAKAGPAPDLRQTILVPVLSFLAPWATVSFPLLTGAILVERGFNLSDTLLYVGVSTFGPFLGAVVAATVADRVQRRTSLIACAVGMAAAAVGFYVSDHPFWLMVTSFGFNLCVALYTPAFNLYVAELVPTLSRARATSWAWSVNRVAAAAGPLILLPWLHSHGPAVVFTVIVGALAASAVLIVCYGSSGKAGQPVS